MPTLRRTLAVLLGAATLAGAAGAQQAPDTRPTVAIIDFTNGAIGKAHDEMEPLRAGIADMLITDLGANEKIRVVERTQLKAVMSELQLGQNAAVDASTAVRMGKLLNAHHIVTGVYVTDARGRLRLDTRSINVETGRIEYTTRVQGKTDDVLDLVEQLAGRMNQGLQLPALEVRAREASAAPAKKPAVPFQAVMLYSRALQALDQQNRTEAVQLFRASLEKFPDYDAAKRQLARLESTDAATKPGA